MPAPKWSAFYQLYKFVSHISTVFGRYWRISSTLHSTIIYLELKITLGTTPCAEEILGGCVLYHLPWLPVWAIPGCKQGRCRPRRRWWGLPFPWAPCLIIFCRILRRAPKRPSSLPPSLWFDRDGNSARREGAVSRFLPNSPLGSKYTHDCTPLSPVRWFRLVYRCMDAGNSYTRSCGWIVYGLWRYGS